MRRWKIVWPVLACLWTVSLALVSCGEKSSVLGADDRASIYAGVIRQVYTVDHTFGVGNRHDFRFVYLQRATYDSAGEPISDSKILSMSLQAAIVVGLRDLPAEFIWVNGLNEVPWNDGAIVGRGATIFFGNIYGQADGSMHVAAGLFFASTGGGGTYIVQLQDGIWTITGRTGKGWIS